MTNPILEGMRVPHDAFTEATRQLQQCYDFSLKKSEAEGLAIIGASGTGKTSVLQAFREGYPPVRQPDGMHIPILFTSVPSDPTPKSLAAAILEALHAPDPERGSQTEKTSRIRVLMKQTGTRMVMIDEFQHFYDRGKNKIMHSVADWLKMLIDSTQTTLVVAGLPTCTAVIDQNEQLARRFLAPIKLPRFDWEVDSDRCQFIGILKAYHGVLSQHYDTPDYATDEMAMRFWAATNGLMGLLSKLLRLAERNASIAVTTLITLEDLHNAHVQAIWSSQRISDLPKPFQRGTDFKLTQDLVNLVKMVGAPIEPEAKTRSAKSRLRP